jgi:uncharacterized membrane protein YebE (DUF533 family)
MPVRIVRDNPDEEVLNENFDFDNPNNNHNNSSYDNNNNYEDNTINDNVNDNNESNANNNSNLDLGNIANLLFGGGGSSSSNTNNSLFGNLASMAIGACVGYAVEYFRNSHQQQRAAGSYSRQEAEELYQARMAATQVCVSIWSYAVGADREFNEAEEQQVQELISHTVNELFPSKVADQDLVRQEMMAMFENPMPYEDAVRQATRDKNFALQVYHQAAMLVAADRSYVGREQNFMNDLAKDLRLSGTDIRPIHQKLGL